MMEKTVIKTENLANYVMFKLDKIDNEFTENELNQITEVVLDYNDEIYLEELLKFKKLKTVTLRNGNIFNDDYVIFLKLDNLSEVVFDNCGFENADLIASLELKALSLINCDVDNYSFINIFKNLEELTIVNGDIKMKQINMLKNLKYLQISYSNIIDNIELNIDTLEELYIDNTNINDFKFLNQLSKLKRLSIDEKQYNTNKELFNNLEKKNILILNENMVEFGGANYGL